MDPNHHYMVRPMGMNVNSLNVGDVNVEERSPAHTKVKNAHSVTAK